MEQVVRGTTFRNREASVDENALVALNRLGERNPDAHETAAR